MAAQPRRSACIPIRFLSRQQKCRIVSIPAPSWILQAVTSGETRELARGPSGMFTASNPASAQIFDFSTVCASRYPAAAQSPRYEPISPSTAYAQDVIFPPWEQDPSGEPTPQKHAPSPLSQSSPSDGHSAPDPGYDPESSRSSRQLPRPKRQIAPHGIGGKILRTAHVNHPVVHILRNTRIG